jgi:hypothetical protein
MKKGDRAWFPNEKSEKIAKNREYSCGILELSYELDCCNGKKKLKKM